MPDNYIDYREISEYGRHFVREVASLEGVSNPFFDMTAIKEHVLQTVQDVEALRGTNVVDGSNLRGGRLNLSTAAEDMRDHLRRFYRFLQSQPKTMRFDMHAFFPRGQTGVLADLKPADALAMTDDVLSGFDSPQNATLAVVAATWQADLLAVRTILAQTLGGRDSSHSTTRSTKRALATARKRFLRMYNGVAKRAVYALLVTLERERDYRGFFLDLQIHERGATGTVEDGAEAPAEPDSAEAPAEPDSAEAEMPIASS